MINLLISAFILAVLLYIHKVDPIYSFFMPILFIKCSVEATVFLSIIASIAIIEHHRYRIPNFVLILALFPIFYSRMEAIVSGLLFLIPMAILYSASRVLKRNIFHIDDLKLSFVVGTFFRSPDLVIPFYIFSFISFVPYSLVNRKIIPLSPPFFVAAYFLSLVSN